MQYLVQNACASISLGTYFTYAARTAGFSAKIWANCSGVITNATFATSFPSCTPRTSPIIVLGKPERWPSAWVPAAAARRAALAGCFQKSSAVTVPPPTRASNTARSSGCVFSSAALAADACAASRSSCFDPAPCVALVTASEKRSRSEALSKLNTSAGLPGAPASRTPATGLLAFDRWWTVMAFTSSDAGAAASASSGRHATAERVRHTRPGASTPDSFALAEHSASAMRRAPSRC